MTRRTPRWLLAFAGTMVLLAGIAAVWWFARRDAGGDRADARFMTTEVPMAQVPIAAEASVFRSRPEFFSVDNEPGRRSAAHPRTLATYRSLRAYPGAPPRIPHGLTKEEYRGVGCVTCHERGGYSQRFGAYAPVTPHPELTACVQCHLADDGMVGIALPSNDPDDVCRQCHIPGATRPTVRLSNAAAAPWPQPVRRNPDGTPPAIPHPLLTRANCLACHMGPGAVAEIRTTHPERANCRSCHVAVDAEVAAFARPAPGAVPEESR
jgi:nitrate reductase (cytochrome), electron transfer subunit